jgi:hypothetical protein
MKMHPLAPLSFIHPPLERVPWTDRKRQPTAEGKEAIESMDRLPVSPELD